MAKRKWTPEKLHLIAEKRCPRCASDLHLFVTASFSGGAGTFSKDGYPYTDLDLVEDRGHVQCGKEGARHFRMNFVEWSELSSNWEGR